MKNLEISCVNAKIASAVVALMLIAAAAAAVHPGTWTAREDLPEYLYFAAVAEVDGIIYAIGGSRGLEGVDTVYAYEPAGDVWTAKAAMPTPRMRATAAVVEGKIYVFGGLFDTFDATTVTTAVEVYDPATDTWEAGTDMPTATWDSAAAAVDGEIYVIGGYPGPDQWTSSVQVYDPAGDSWDTAADMPTSRGGLGVSVVDGLIYAVGGWPGSRIPFATEALEIYDPATDTWTVAAGMPTPRDWFTTAAIDGKVYALGGLTYGDAWASIVHDVEVYDPQTGLWEHSTRMPDERFGLGAAVIDDKIFLIGGADKLDYFGSKYVDTYDPNLYTSWTEVAAHLSGASGSQWRTDVCAANLNNDAANVELVLHTDTGNHVHSDIIEPSQQKAFDDVVGQMDIEDKGLLEVSSDQPLRVSGRTFNDGGDGTFGQMSEFRTMDDGLFTLDEAWIVGMRQEEGLFRTNVTVANTGIRRATVLLEFFDGDGAKLGQVVKPLGPGTFDQILEPFAYDVGAPNVGWGFLKVRIFGGAGILVSASVIDSRTNDATTIVAQR